MEIKTLEEYILNELYIKDKKIEELQDEIFKLRAELEKIKKEQSKENINEDELLDKKCKDTDLDSSIDISKFISSLFGHTINK